MRLTDELTALLDSIPSGLCIYRLENNRVYPVFHNKTFFEILGYSQPHREQIEREMTYLGVHAEDLPAVREKVTSLMREGSALSHTCRIFNDRLGEYRWIHVEGSMVRRDNGPGLLYGVYSDVTAQKRLEIETADAREKMDHLVNSIPGGIGRYRMKGERFQAVFVSDGVVALSGYSREEYEEITRSDGINLIYEADRQRVIAAAKGVAQGGRDMAVSCRIRQKNGRLAWIHLNGRRIARTQDAIELSVVFTGMSAESQLFQNIVNETADGVYVIDKENYDLLYANENKALFAPGKDCIGQKCYQALHGKSAPCGFCTLGLSTGEKEHAMVIDGEPRSFVTRFKETVWNGIPAYVKYVRDITEEESVRHEKERLEGYFQTLVNKLPGGVAVIRCGKDGNMRPEFLSEGFAALTGMSLEDAWNLYREDAAYGVHPDDKTAIAEQMSEYAANGEKQCELLYRLIKGDGGYVWVKNTLSLIKSDHEASYIYAVYYDMTAELEEQARIRKQYNDLIIEHYQMQGPNTLVLGHCNITQGKILDILDHTGLDLLNRFGDDRDGFFTGISELIVDEDERQAFQNVFFSAPALAAFERGETEKKMDCFIRLTAGAMGRYARFHMNMVKTPDSGDVTGILTIVDITEQMISDRILHHISVAGYDFVVDLDLSRDSYKILSCNEQAGSLPPCQGCHSKWMDRMLKSMVVPKDWEKYRQGLSPEQMKKTLEKGGAYTFAYSILDEKGEILTKNMTVTPIDMRIGRVCLVRTDITNSIREQQGLLNMLAYTFEVMAYINVGNGRMTVYTRDVVLKKLPPFVADRYSDVVNEMTARYRMAANAENSDEINAMFQLETLLKRLSEKPAGYDFVLPRHTDNGIRYKQINVLWGDENHRTICMVRADVTDILAAERQSKKTLEEALVLAREASRAKSDFLSSMSHDIRTPMNAIMGMTALAVAHQDDQARVADCLQKISASSRHLLSLINDILDMSKIEHSQIALNRQLISLSELLAQITDIVEPQARAAGLTFDIQADKTTQTHFIGDSLRISQVLLNLLGNAVKFTGAGGRVRLLIEEIPPEKDGAVRFRFTISDNGIGISDTFISHIFEPFARDDAASRTEGTGLGLAITKGLIELMNGSISVTSKLNEGAEFQVELEFDRANEEEVAALAAAEEVENDGGGEGNKPLAGRRFLVAEDNAINAEILCEILKLFGAASTLKTDGIQTVKEFRDALPGAYDAILMDIQMPEMNGYEATRAIRSLERADAKTIPILAMTANAFAEDVRAALDAGMQGHVAKPVNIKLLRETLIKILPGGGRR